MSELAAVNCCLSVADVANVVSMDISTGVPSVWLLEFEKRCECCARYGRGEVDEFASRSAAMTASVVGCRPDEFALEPYGRIA